LGGEYINESDLGQKQAECRKSKNPRSGAGHRVAEAHLGEARPSGRDLSPTATAAYRTVDHWMIQPRTI
jgi:hypothetical protein